MEKSIAATAGIPFGQPILVGHHSEKAHRAAIDRAWRAADRSVEERDLAKHHRDKAEGLSDYLENTIFDDDPDAIERIQQKIAGLEKAHALMLAVNKVVRRNKKLDDASKISELINLGLTESAAKEAIHPSESWKSVGFDSYVLSNNNANIRRYKERLVSLQKRQERKAAAESSKNGVLIQKTAYGYTVTFAEKPEYRIIAALKNAGYYWSKGSWRGSKALPPEVEELK